MDSTFLDIEKAIEDNVALSIRAFMELDTDFKYSPDEKSSKIRITASRPKDPDMKKPHVYVSVTGYSVAEGGLSGGYTGDIIVTEGTIEREISVYRYKVNFSAEIMVVAANSSDSKNLANRLVSRLFIRGRKAILDNLSINIQGIQKGRESKTQLSQNSGDLFVNPIGISGEFWMNIQIYEKELSGILDKYIVDLLNPVNRTYRF